LPGNSNINNSPQNSLNVSTHWPLTIATGLSSVLNILLPLILTRLLPVSEIGAYKLLFLYLGFIPWLTMSSALMQSLYVYANTKQFNKIYTGSSILIFLFSLLLIAIVLVAEKLHLLDFNILNENFTFILFAILTTSLNPLLEEVLISKSSIKKAAVVIFLFDSLRTLTMIFCAIYFKDLHSVISAFVIMSLVKVLYGVFESFRLNLYSLPTISQPKELIYFALPLSLAGALSVFTSQGDQLIISNYINLQEYTYYALGCLLLPFLSSFEQSVNKVLFTNLASHQLNLQMTIDSFRKSIAEISSILIPASLGLSTFSVPIIKILYTSQYEKSGEYLKFYAFFYLLLIIPFDLVAKSAKKTNSVLAYYFIGSVVGLSTSFVLIPYWGAWGALASLFMGQICMRLFGFIHGARIINCSVYDLIPWKPIAHYLVTAIALSLICYGLKFFFSNDSVWFFTTSPLFFIVYFLLHLRKKWFKA
jgi:O-antigen/teichoic acid export membrane protein